MSDPAEDRLKQNPSQGPIWKPLKMDRARATEGGPGRRQWQGVGTEKKELSGLQTTTFGQ